MLIVDSGVDFTVFEWRLQVGERGVSGIRECVCVYVKCLVFGGKKMHVRRNCY